MKLFLCSLTNGIFMRMLCIQRSELLYTCTMITVFDFQQQSVDSTCIVHLQTKSISAR